MELVKNYDTVIANDLAAALQAALGDDFRGLVVNLAGPDRPTGAVRVILADKLPPDDEALLNSANNVLLAHDPAFLTSAETGAGVYTVTITLPRTSVETVVPVIEGLAQDALTVLNGVATMEIETAEAVTVGVQGHPHDAIEVGS